MNYLSELTDFLKQVQPMLNILLGGILAILGGIAGAWLQAKYARRTRMDQIIAERAVDANSEAYAHMKDIEAKLVQDTLQNTYRTILKQQEWLIKSRLYLPGRFPDKWFAIRNKLTKAVRLQQKLAKTTTQQTADKLTQLEGELKDLVEEAILEIYKEMKLSRIKA